MSSFLNYLCSLPASSLPTDLTILHLLVPGQDNLPVDFQLNLRCSYSMMCSTISLTYTEVLKHRQSGLILRFFLYLAKPLFLRDDSGSCLKLKEKQEKQLRINDYKGRLFKKLPMLD